MKNKVGSGRVLSTPLLATLLLCAGCATTSPGPEPPAPLVGLADYHNHQFGYLGFGGSVASHSIDPATSCLPVPSFNGASFRVRDLVRSGLFAPAQDQAGRGECYPAIKNIASQRVDTGNLWRAWQYGLRLMVMFAVSSEFLCEAGQLAQPCPSDRAAIEQQLQAAKDLEAQIDRQAGGPGQGWYRIVYTPEQARRVIGEGKLAVVLGIEAANAFGCAIRRDSTVSGVPPINPFEAPPPESAYRRDCSAGLISEVEFLSLVDPAEDQLGPWGPPATHKALALFEHYWRLGVRHFYLVHNIDGLAAGTALSVSLLHADHNPAEIHPGSPLTDRTVEVNRLVRQIRPPHVSTDCGSRFPFDGGRCNDRGLADLGRQLARLMAAHGTLIDADHLSFKSRRELLASDGLLGGVYPFISSHSGVSALMPSRQNDAARCNANEPDRCNANNEGQLAPEDIDDIIRAGGAFAPRLPTVTGTADQSTYPAGATAAPHSCGGTSESFVQAYRYLVEKLRQGRLLNGNPAFAGVGIGTDFGAPVPVFAAPRFMVSGDVTGFTADADLEFLRGLFVGGPRPDAGRCHVSGERPMVDYASGFTSRLAGELRFFKSETPWDGRASQPGYDISFDGIVHVGMLPDFVQELRALGLTESELDPLWYGAEAYIRTWETAQAWKDSFDNEGSRGVRAHCENQRALLLAAEDGSDGPAVVSAMRELRSSRCRGVP